MVLGEIGVPKHKVQWQKARFLPTSPGKEFLRYRELWVEILPPFDHSGEDPIDHEIHEAPSYMSNLLDDTDCQMNVAHDAVELVCEFTDEVELVPISSWGDRYCREGGGSGRRW